MSKDAVEATLHLGFTSAGLPVALDFIDLPESLRHKYQYYTCADISRLRAAGGTAHGSLERAVRGYVGRCMGLGWTRDEGGFGGGND